MNDNYFDLGGFNKVGGSADIGSEVIEETGEFAPQSVAKTGADNQVPDPTAPVPAPASATLEDGEKGPKPPQTTAMPGETEVKKDPAAGHEMGPKIPQGTEISLEDWKTSMRTLQQSFKEAGELIQILESCKIVEKTAEQRQQEYTESVLAEAMVKAYEDGPYFEAVTRDDKNDVKKIVRTVRGRLSSWCDDNDVKFKPVSALMKLISVEWWNTRFWQVTGAIYIEAGNVEKVVAQMNKDLDEYLGDYKIIPSGCYMPTILDSFRVKLNWKNQKGIAILLIDKKLPFEFSKEEQLRVAKKLEPEKKGKGKKDDDVKTESSCTCGECDDCKKKAEEEKKKESEKDSEDNKD